MSIEKGRKHFVCEALSDIKALQDVITNFHSKYYGQLLMKIVGSDTIPLFLITNNGAHLRLLDTGKQFETEYFRIDLSIKSAVVALFRCYGPMIMKGMRRIQMQML